MVDTHRLKYFLRIAEEGSITGAARSLGIAQPALSRQIRLLEDDIGVVLFRRTRRGVELTEEGERLRASTAGPLRLLELAVQYAGSPLARLERGIRLGLHETAVDVLTEPLVAGLSATFPDVSFALTAGSTEHLIDGMLKGTVDFALINPVPDDRVFYRDLVAEELVVVGGPRSELEHTQAVAFTAVVQLPLAIPRSPAGIGTILENAALRMKTTVDYRITTDSLAATKRLIEAGLVYAVLPRSACAREIAGGQMHCAPIYDPVLTHHLGVAATSHLELPRDLTAKLGNILREEVSHLVGTGAWPATLLSPREWDPQRF